jgi:[protein-PII] uridylyltransferase
MERNGVWSSFRKSGDVSLLTVITRDYPRALSDICGVITASDINIVGARIFTREDGIIIDTFLVTGPDFGANIPADIQRAFKSNIGRVIGRTVEVTSLIDDYRRRWKRRKRNVVFSPPRIRVHNDISSRHTVVDVFAIDYTGLLYDITSVLASLDIDIHTARIGTDEDQVADAFYIQGADGGKIEDAAAVERLKTAIIDRLNEAYG